MKTVRMISKSPHVYRQTPLRIGDVFDAEEIHVKMLVATGRAKPHTREMTTQVKAALTDKPKHDGKEKK